MSSRTQEQRDAYALHFDRSVRTSDPPPTAVRISAVPEDFDLAPAYAASTQANAEGVFQLRGVSGSRRHLDRRRAHGYGRAADHPTLTLEFDVNFAVERPDRGGITCTS